MNAPTPLTAGAKAIFLQGLLAMALEAHRERDLLRRDIVIVKFLEVLDQEPEAE